MVIVLNINNSFINNSSCCLSFIILTFTLFIYVKTTSILKFCTIIFKFFQFIISFIFYDYINLFLFAKNTRETINF